MEFERHQATPPSMIIWEKNTVMKRMLPLAAKVEANVAQGEVLRFGTYALYRNQRLLLDGNEPVPIGSRALEILIALVDRAGHVVSKEELIAHAWPQTIVEETNLRVHIAALRRALGDGQTPNRYILNVVGRGYSFVSPVTVDVESGVPRQSAVVAPPSRHFPLPLNPVLGREEDIAKLTALLKTRRLITIVGGGGLGKTTLALATASQLSDSFPDGAYFVDLAGISDPSLICNAFVAVLGLSVDKDDPISDLLAFLQGSGMVLVLDNCEHLIEAAASITERILQSAAHVRILATSREPLRAAGEYQYQLAHLDVPTNLDAIAATSALQFPAIQLFVERAKDSTRIFDLTDSNAAAVGKICQRLDGNPLAIELAAARLSSLGVHELAERLEDQFFLITNGRRTAAPRHQTLRATLDWSYELLGKSAQTTLQRLALFNAAFTVESAIAVAAHRGFSAHDVSSAVMSLAVKSLISTDLTENPARHRLLFTTRAYAFEKLSQSEDSRDIFRWHCEYVAKLMRQAAMNWETMPRSEWIARYEYALEDVRAALNWAFSSSGDSALGAEITALSVAYGYQMGLLDEFHDRVEQALGWLATLPTRQPILESRLNSAMASMFIDRSGSKRSDVIGANESSELTGSAKYQVGPLLQKSILQIEEADYRAAVGTARKLKAVAARTGDPLAVLLADRVMAQAQHFYGDHLAARTCAESVLDHSAQSLPLSYIAMQVDRRVTMRIVLARILWLEGFADGAVKMIDEALEYASVDGPFAICQALALGACPIALWRGDHSEARRLIALLLEQGARFKIDRWRNYGECYEQINCARVPNSDTELPVSSQLSHRGLSAGLMAHTLATMDPGISEDLLPRPSFYEATGWCASEVWRLHGQRCLGKDPLDSGTQAEAAFMKSLEIAVAQNALSWQLRTSMSLAALWREQNQLEKARSQLSSVYLQFGEGHDTCDLRAAATLLEQLH
jgi:predicted ATPase/DNA-binding winged helix-turn-helix (wHTH) protein